MSYMNVVMEMLIRYPKKDGWGQMALFKYDTIQLRLS